MIKKYLGRKETDKGEVDEWKGMNVSGAPDTKKAEKAPDTDRIYSDHFVDFDNSWNCRSPGKGYAGKERYQIPEISIPWISSWMAGEESEAVQTENMPDTESPQTQAPKTEAVQTEAVTDSEEETALAEADRLAVQYDYDGAIARLQSSSVYESSTRMQEAAEGYAETKAACVEYTPSR